MSGARRRGRNKSAVYAISDPTRKGDDGVCAVGSFQALPASERPYKVTARKEDEPDRFVIVTLTRAEALKLARDFLSFAGEPREPIARKEVTA